MGYELCGMRMERPAVGKGKGGDFVGERGGASRWCGVRRDPSTQPLAIKPWAASLGMTDWSVVRGRTGNGKCQYRDSGYARMTTLGDAPEWRFLGAAPEWRTGTGKGMDNWITAILPGKAERVLDSCDWPARAVRQRSKCLARCYS